MVGRKLNEENSFQNPKKDSLPFTVSLDDDETGWWMDGRGERYVLLR